METVKELEAECDRIAVDIAKAINNGNELVADIKDLRKRLDDYRYKLCEKCGHYKERYLSPCPSCRYKKLGELYTQMETKSELTK